MSRLTELESFCKLLLVSSLAIWGISFWYKDVLPPPDFYDGVRLDAPTQQPSYRDPFVIESEGAYYRIKPLYDYQLHGVVVTYSNADGFGNIWHHRRWKDFLNVRDLCVIWGTNVRSGVYKQLDFSSDSWTCWVQWGPEASVAAFRGTEISNNHLLVDNHWLKRALLKAEPGDVVQFSGMLVEYENPASGFKRGSSIRRDDSGNGACETVFLDDFSVIKKANSGWRLLYSIAKWMSILSFIAVVILMFIAPIQRHWRAH